MKRLILEIGSVADLYGQDHTKAALRALDDALRYISIILFGAIELNHSDMYVNVTIGVNEPTKVDVGEITEAVPRGLANVNIVFGVQNIDARRVGQPSVIATCAVGAFIPDITEYFEIGYG